MQPVPLGPLHALHWPARAPRAGQTVVAVHGVWVGAHVWAQVGTYLAAHGYDTYAVWLRHHEPGGEYRRLDGLGLHDYAADVAAAVSEVDRPVLVGHSMGGLLAQMVATRTTLVGVALLASAPPRGIPAIPHRSLVGPGLCHGLGSVFKSRFMHPFGDDAFLRHLSPDQQADLMARRVPEPRRVGWQLTFWPPAVEAAHVRCPVFVAGGTDDPVIRPWVTRQVAGRYRVVPALYQGSGHMLNLEPGWQSIADDLRHWIARHV